MDEKISNFKLPFPSKLVKDIGGPKSPERMPMPSRDRHIRGIQSKNNKTFWSSGVEGEGPQKIPVQGMSPNRFNTIFKTDPKFVKHQKPIP